jgi:hypothetical protein
MISDKTARDRANNQKFKDTYVHASQEPWLPFFPGIEFKSASNDPRNGALDRPFEMREGVGHSQARTSGSR